MTRFTIRAPQAIVGGPTESVVLEVMATSSAVESRHMDVDAEVLADVLRSYVPSGTLERAISILTRGSNEPAARPWRAPRDLELLAWIEALLPMLERDKPPTQAMNRLTLALVRYLRTAGYRRQAQALDAWDTGDGARLAAVQELAELADRLEALA